jgi:hypothetical protein
VDYFWGALHVSPDQKRVCTFGWHWGPVGQLTHFSIEKWMQGELYAMEVRPNDMSDWLDPLGFLSHLVGTINNFLPH